MAMKGLHNPRLRSHIMANETEILIEDQHAQSCLRTRIPNPNTLIEKQRIPKVICMSQWENMIIDPHLLSKGLFLLGEL